MAENLIYSSLEKGRQPANSIFNDAQKQGISFRTLKTVKSTMPVYSIKENGIWYWEMNNEEAKYNAK